MREVEFRAWIDDSSLCNDVEIEKHLDEYGNFIPFMQNLNEWYMDDGQTLGDFLDSFRGNLMQYTGVKDIHGVKIFEGDIVEYEDYTSLYLLKEQPKVKGVISLGNFSNGIYLKGMGTFKGSKLEVIGNIHENLELLEEDM